MTLKQWADNGWLRPHKTSPKEVQNLLAIVTRDLADAAGAISADWRFGIAYNAALKLESAVMRVFSLRRTHPERKPLLSGWSRMGSTRLRLAHHESPARKPFYGRLKHAGIKHQLKDRVDLVPDENPLKPALRAIEHLAAYATAYRYPTVSGRIAASPARAVLEEAAAKVETALTMAAGRFRVDLAKPNASAGNAAPIR